MAARRLIIVMLVQPGESQPVARDVTTLEHSPYLRAEATWMVATDHILRFAVWGYPAWAAWAVAIGQILGAVLLLWPRTFAAGAWLLAAISAGFVVTHLASGDGRVVLVPLAMLAGLAGLALARRG